jgi:hypothetical protein
MLSKTEPFSLGGRLFKLELLTSCFPLDSVITAVGMVCCQCDGGGIGNLRWLDHDLPPNRLVGLSMPAVDQSVGVGV